MNFLPLNRRDWLRTAAIGIGAGSMSGWFRAFAAETATNPQRQKSVILLWLQGGSATIDLWDLKPGMETGGPFKEIETAAPGMKISEHLPQLAHWANEMAIVRSMTSKEGDHERATYFVRTGYIPQGALKFPALGSLLAGELRSETSDLPSFVSIAPGRFIGNVGGGFLGPQVAPFMIGSQDGGVDGLVVPDLQRPEAVSNVMHQERLALLNGLNGRFALRGTNSVVESVQSASERAARLMQPAAATAFRLSDEPEKLRDTYGRTVFGQGCLLARRLVERGVPFVEVTLDGWDTHQQNFERVKRLSGTLDIAFAALLQDLKDRGLLESTLVICQGEFGRTPKINGQTGRDHWPDSWATVLAGGNLRGGQVIGKTSADGTTIEDRPITVPDLIATVCKSLGIDPRKQNMSNVGRPIRIADPNAQPIDEVLA